MQHRGPAVVLGDFTARLTAAMAAKQQLNFDEAGMAIAQELAARLDKAGSEVLLQLRSWHAAEAIGKRRICEGYPIES